MQNENRNKIALSLSGGGAKAFTYLGFVRSLEQNRIPIDFLYAHSGAAWVLAFLASDLDDQSIIKIFSKFRMWKFIAPNIWKNRGLVDNKRLISYFHNLSNGKKIEDLPYKTAIGITDVTDYYHPKEVMVTSGSLAKYSVISSVIPPIQPLYREDGKIFADGGMLTLFGAKFLREQGMDKIVGLYFDAMPITGIMRFLQEPIHSIKSLMSAREVYERSAYPIDIEINDFDTTAGLVGFSKAQEMYEAGFAKGEELIPQLKKMLIKDL